MATMDESPKRRPAKRDRLETRLRPDVKARLQYAADLQGRTLSDFVLESAQHAAEQVIHEHAVISLTEQDSRIFVEAVLTPPAPSPRLHAAAARYLDAVEER
jgi:uncharacterized protein (DUF1778 family)